MILITIHIQTFWFSYYLVVSVSNLIEKLSVNEISRISRKWYKDDWISRCLDQGFSDGFRLTKPHLATHVNAPQNKHLWMFALTECCLEVWLFVEESPRKAYLHIPPVASYRYREKCVFMMTSSDRNIFRVTGLLCGEFTGHRWNPLQKG